MQFLAALSDASRETLIWWASAVVIFGLTEVIKMPIKKLTSKITDDNRRHLWNSFILTIPFILGCVAVAIYNCALLKVPFDFMSGLKLGMAAISLYAVFERFTKTKIENPYEEGEGKELLDKIEELTDTTKPDDTTKPEKPDKKVKANKNVDSDIEKINAILDEDNKQ